MIETNLNTECYSCPHPELRIEKLVYNTCDGEANTHAYVVCLKKEECNKNLKKS